MSRKFLGKAIAGAALGGASLLVWAPASATAESGRYPESHRQGDRGHAFTRPQAARPGHQIRLLQVCPEPQKQAWLWSKVTGKVDLAPGSGPAERGEARGRDGSARQDGGGDGDGGDGWAEDGTPSGERDSTRGRDGSGAGFAYWTSIEIPGDAEPGHYPLKGSCGGGELIVLPNGGIEGGDGGATSGNSDNLAVGGVGLLGVAALGGLALLRGRRGDDSSS
ncbi:hypothetical protein [Plantactinospora sp. CA-290183]|uniref:hypothetical protein n=1 Tax=Plantactinospora sp. CA-290183 TaxID=3240006 RepID=UPI003D89F764